MWPSKSNGRRREGKTPPWLEHYDTDVPREIYIPNITLNDILARSVAVHREHAAFFYFGKKYTYSEFDRAIRRVVAGFQKIGVRKGDRIAFVLPNMPQFLFSYWAALRLGAIVAPINPLFSGREIAACINLIEPKVIIVLDRLYDKLRDDANNVMSAECIAIASIDTFMPQSAKLYIAAKKVLTGRRSRKLNARVRPFKELFDNRPADAWDEPKAEDTAALLFTGGVTGTPKAVQLLHKNLVANVLQTRAWLGHLKDGHDVVIGVLPFFHSYGMTTCHHLAIQLGATLILEPRFHALRVIRLIQKHKVTIFPGVPTMYRAIADEIQFSGQKLDHVRICVSGGAPLSSALKQQFEALTGSTLVEGYGLSEASPLTHCNPLYSHQKKDSIGLPCPNTQARIVHLRTGKVLPQNSVGELEVKGPQVMRSFWKNEKETQNVLRNGWLSTGDIAYMDQDGFFYIIDRKKDLILHGGFNVYPSEVEDVLSQHPDIKEVAVVGEADDYYGEIIKAFIVPQDGRVCQEQEMVNFCRKNLAHFKVPKKFVIVDSLPKNFLGKVVKRNLKNSPQNR